MQQDLKELGLDVLAGAYPPTFIASKVAVHTLTRIVDEVASSKY